MGTDNKIKMADNIDDLLAQIENTEVSTAKKSKKKKKGGNKTAENAAENIENNKNVENKTETENVGDNAENPQKLTKNQKQRLAAKKKKIAEKGVGEQTDPPG